MIVRSFKKNISIDFFQKSLLFQTPRIFISLCGVSLFICEGNDVLFEKQNQPFSVNKNWEYLELKSGKKRKYRIQAIVHRVCPNYQAFSYSVVMRLAITTFPIQSLHGSYSDGDASDPMTKNMK